MSQILITNQKPTPYASLNVAQINEALVTYAADATITAGLDALKVDILAAIPGATNCPQCGGAQATGKITKSAVDYICPLCNGMTKTEGQYLPVTGPVIGFDKIV
jgi:Zn finger protein HypA/HybF involved in hydrogenase expression